MRIQGKTELQDRLAAEYVLGTLRGPARLRFQAWMREHAELRRRVAEWEERLAPLAGAVNPVTPPQRVWRGIEARVALPAGASVASERKPGFWGSVAFWRGWGLVATACAAALVVVLALRPPETVEVVRTVEVVKEVRPDPTVRQPSYVAVLRDDKGNPVYLAYAARKASRLWVKRLAIDPPGEGKGHELWGLHAAQGKPPKSLGMLPRDSQGTITLDAVADESLRDFAALAITLEPAAGSGGKATGPVVAKGDCVQFW